MAYEPESIPDDLEAVLEYLGRELRRIAGEFTTGAGHILLPELNSVPDKPRAGMIVLADGTNWDPGSGAGFYGYRGGAWMKLG